ncbi:MAG: transglycosylase domain-containing protein, partial [Armatimonadetes bacterium]|nr:transglycosylase domain-containing protein [Armatimonadota bacterium]
MASQPVNLRQISPNVVRAFLAAEDNRFFSHGGVDALALLRATLQNLRARRIVSGGSTLTMQLARLLRPKRRSVIGKVSEVYTAW